VRAGLGDDLAPAFLRACREATGGNPLLVNALAGDSLVQARGTPARLEPGSGFRSAVITCLHSHEPRLVRLAEALAVLGENATPTLLAEMLETTVESVGQGTDALAASGLLESARFRHEAARQAVLEHTTADERAASHARAARILYRTGAPSTVLAAHLMAAHSVEAEWAVPVLQDAAELALADEQPDRAIGYLRRAETEAADDRQRAAIRFDWAWAEWRANPERAVRHMTDLVADARAGRLDSQSVGRLAYYLLWAGDTGKAIDILTSLDATDGAVPRRAPIWSALGFLYPDVAQRIRSAASAAEQDDTEDTLSDAERILRENGENERALAAITTALMALIVDDRLDRAAFWCNVLRHDSVSFSPLWDALLAGFWAMIETRRGNLPAAQSHAHTALTRLTRQGWGVAIGIPLSSLLLTSIASSRQEEAAGYLRVPVPEAMFRTPYGLLYLHARGEYYLATGRAQAALADFQACGDRMMMWGLDRPGLVPWRSKAAEAHVALGDQDAARELAGEQLAQAGSRSSRTKGISLRATALTSPLTKRIALLQESAEILRESGARLELAYTFTALADAHRAAGDHDRAHWAARQAQNLMERCGARAPKNRTGGRSDGRHVRANGNGERPPTQLSNAERRVAMLAAYGYTNCQIAKRLFITVSTVEQHLTRVYRKLGVSGRTELPIEI
jgi:DNA-binding CsgD family transcriptional regulator